MERRGLHFEAYAPNGNGCGHEHATERGALACVRGQRRVCAVDRDGTRRPIWLTPAERAARDNGQGSPRLAGPPPPKRRRRGRRREENA